ncbi:hypothetical protein CC80DRAFT_543562 [Byssothecium circinans]|uniref:Protein kinase domain-containing protein n=1 Tax=Byssothecium circinans TaxID=147558 RepID=A0A6A5U8J6_9PLEO|nr:hypothetical protein CC80DRAFT_543562 [Byssothecium circinans]
MLLADFGCALQRSGVWKDKKKKRKTASFMTAGWESPEVQNHENYSTRSDVYQLGLVMGCICNLVFDPSEFDHHKPAPGYTEELNKTIAACLTVKQYDRPKSWEVLNYAKKHYANLMKELEANARPNPSAIADLKAGHPVKRPKGYQPPRYTTMGPNMPPFGGLGGGGGMQGRFGSPGGPGMGRYGLPGGFGGPGMTSPGGSGPYPYGGGSPVDLRLLRVQQQALGGGGVSPRQQMRMARLQRGLGGGLGRGPPPGFGGMQRAYTDPSFYGGMPPGFGPQGRWR